MSFYRTRRWSHSVPAYTPVANTAVTTPADVDACKARIAAIEAHERFSTLGPRDSEFLASVKGQVERGRVFSSPQASWVERIEKRLATVPSTFDANDAAQVAKRAYAIMHYKATGYWSVVVAAMEANADYMPDADTYDRMWANKFINAGFKRYSAGAKYGAGDMVKAKIYGAKHDGIVAGIKWSCTANNWLYDTLILAGVGMYAEHVTGRNVELKETDVSIDRAAIAAAKKAEKEAEKAAKAEEKARLKAEKEAAKALAALNKPARKPRAKKSA